MSNQRLLRKQLVPANVHQDNRLNSAPLHDLVDFIQGFLKKALVEKKSIEIEGKLGRFFTKSNQRQIQEVDQIRIHTIDTISFNNIVLMKPFQEFFKFESSAPIKDFQNQVRFYDSLHHSKEKTQNGDTNEYQDFQKYCYVSDIVDFDTFSRCQNDIVVDFSFEDGTRLKVPLNTDEKITLDKKNRDASNNIDFAFSGFHYRISAREEEDITDQTEVNKKIVDVKDGKYLSVRIKHRKAYNYLFMEYAFTRVFSFANLTKKKVIEGHDQFISETYEEFNEKVGCNIFKRKLFTKQAQIFFQKCFSTNYIMLTKFEAEIEIKDVKKYFKKEFDNNDQPTIQSHIRSFIRNLIYLNSISEFYVNMSEQVIREHKKLKNINTPTGFKEGILGQYIESHLFQK